jgi:GDP-mannose 6-dehydrogenase
MKKVAIFGIGYVGCVTAACLARDGNEVIGVDVDAAKVGELNRGQSPILEPGLDDLIAEQVRSGRLKATTSLPDAVAATDLALVTVGTPSAEDGSVGSGAVEKVVAAIAEAARSKGEGYGIVVRSTLLPGILEERLSPLVGGNVWLSNNPEFLREGTAIKDYDNPPFVLVGAPDAASAASVLDLYSGLAPRIERLVTDTRTAGLVKYTCNAFHALKVAFANEIGSLSRSLGAVGHEVMDIVCRDTRLNISPAYMKPGFAFGGSCLPKDVRALCRHAEQQALGLNLLSSIIPSNDSHLRRAIRMVHDSGHRKVGVVGLSFKAGTDDLRESPQVILVETLLGRGFDIKIYDPNVAVSRLRGRNLAYVDRHLPHLAALLVDDPRTVFEHSNLLILATDVANGIDWRTAYHGSVLDLRRDLACPPTSVPAGASAGMAALSPITTPA